ncbi:MAG: DUF5615 family PIN-like protein [Pirellulales bacterium]
MPVAIKIDEDLPAEIALRLRAAGHNCTTVYEQGHCGLPDEQLWPIVQSEGRLLITGDKGFGNARAFPPGSHAGVILLRLPRESRAGYIRLVEFLLANMRLENALRSIVVVSPDAIRMLKA